MAKAVKAPKKELTEVEKKAKRSEAAKKAAATRAANKAKKALEQTTGATQSTGESKPTTKTKVEFWVRQIRLKGRTITGEVKPEDKKEFLDMCKANGVDIDERDWFKKEDWRARVFKNYDVVREKELMDAKLAALDK